MSGLSVGLIASNGLCWTELVANPGQVRVEFDPSVQGERGRQQQRHSGDQGQCSETIPEAHPDGPCADREDQRLESAADDDQRFVQRDTHDVASERT